MKYAVYVFYRFINESKSPLSAFLKSKMILSMLLGFNAITLLIVILPDWILNKYIGYMFLSLPVFFMIVSLLIKEKVILKPEFAMRYKKSHMWFMLLYFLLTFGALCTVIMSDFNPNYRRKHEVVKEPNVKEVFTEGEERNKAQD